jgi:hypothetical protein
MPPVAALALAATCAIVAMCPADRDDAGGLAGATPRAEHDLRATLQRSRLFETRRALEVLVRNDGDHEVRFGAVQLGSPLFEPVAPQPRDPVLRPGDAAVSMPLQFGTADCDAVADGPPQLVAGIGGHEVRIDLAESPDDVLAKLHASECAVTAAREGADLRLGDDWEQTGPRTVEGEVEMAQRRSGVTTTVEGLEGNVIFTLEALTDDAAPLLEVSDDSPSAAVGVAITASRCDPHALIEYKRTFTFVALVDVGADRPLRVDIKAEGDTLHLLEDVLRACIE